jgi:putative alpha-1,2-mannosidase
MACRFSDHLDSIINHITSFNSELPLFEKYLALFPNQPILHAPLRGMYIAYIDYCLEAVKQLQKNAFG